MDDMIATPIAPVAECAGESNVWAIAAHVNSNRRTVIALFELFVAFFRARCSRFRDRLVWHLGNSSIPV
jgi:hypothetical protein